MARRGDFDLSRRHVLCGLGSLLALPLLPSLGSRGLHAAKKRAKKITRMVFVSNPFGMDRKRFFPEKGGKDYELTPYLKPFEKLRKDITVIKNVDHQIFGLGHAAPHTFLSSIDSRKGSMYKEKNITVDQKYANFIEGQTRFASMQIGVGGGECQLSFTNTGINLPVMEIKDVYEKLFFEPSAKEKLAIKTHLDNNRSILDFVLGEAKDLKRHLNTPDKGKLDQYFDAIRGVEKGIGQKEHWLHKPKAKTDMKFSSKGKTMKNMPMAFELIKLAMMSDTCRVFTLECALGSIKNFGFGVSNSYHTVTHHGMRDNMLRQLYAIEQYQMDQLAVFLQKLKDTEDTVNGGNLLDSTIVLFGSGMSEGFTHKAESLPMILAGGGANHGEHRIYPRKGKRTVTPASNLLLSILQRGGMEIDHFGRSTGTLTGLKWS